MLFSKRIYYLLKNMSPCINLNYVHLKYKEYPRIFFMQNSEVFFIDYFQFKDKQIRKHLKQLKR